MTNRLEEIRARLEGRALIKSWPDSSEDISHLLSQLDAVTAERDEAQRACAETDSWLYAAREQRDAALAEVEGLKNVSDPEVRRFVDLDSQLSAALARVTRLERALGEISQFTVVSFDGLTSWIGNGAVYVAREALSQPAPSEKEE